jgi:hypothetical protein
MLARIGAATTDMNEGCDANEWFSFSRQRARKGEDIGYKYFVS